MIDWGRCKPLQPHRVRFLSSDGHVHDVMHYELDQAREIDPDLRVVATTPEEWEHYVFEEYFAEHQWNKRKLLTIEDMKFLSACGIAWGKSISWHTERVDLYSLWGDEH
jgi:hypothetical protein